MTRFSVSLILLFCFQFLISQSVDETDLNLVSKNLNAMGPSYHQGTARNMAMAGSMGALGGDMSAVLTNAGGGGVFMGPQLSMTLDYGATNDKVQLGTTNQSDISYFQINQFGALFSFETFNADWKLFNLGILYNHENLDESIEFGRNDSLSASDFDINNNDIDQYSFRGYNREKDGKKEKFTINFSTNYKNKLYLGMNVNIHSYRMSYSDQYLGYLAANKETYGFDSWGYPYKEESSGFSVGLGAIYKPINSVRLGAAFQSPISWSDISTEYRQYYYNNSSGIVEENYDDGLWEEDNAVSAGFFTLSMGFVVKKSFAFNFDFNHYLNTTGRYSPSSDYTGTNSFIKKHVHNSNEFRFGGEYRWKNLRFRGGYALQTSPVKNISLEEGYIDGENQHQTGNITNFLSGEQQTIGLGFGYDFNNLFLDFAYQNRKQYYHTLLYGDHADPGYYPLRMPHYLGKVDQKINNFVLTIGYNF